MSALQPTFTITIDPTQDVLDIEQGKIVGTLTPYAVNAGGLYQVTYASTVKYHDSDLPVNKVVLYNTTDNRANGWFYVINSGDPEGQIIQIGTAGTQHTNLYAFLVDITSGDNTGTGTVTVTQLG